MPFTKDNKQIKLHKSELVNIWNLYFTGKTEEAFISNKKLLEESNRSSSVYNQCVVLNSLIALRKGEFKDALVQAKLAEELSKNQKDKAIKIMVQVALIGSLIYQDSSNEIINKHINIVESLFKNQDFQNGIVLEQYSLYLRMKGVFLSKQGNFESIKLGIDNDLKSLEIEEKLGRTYNLLLVMRHISVNYYTLGDISKCTEYLFKVIDFIEQSPEKNLYTSLLSGSYTQLGGLYGDQGDLDKALIYIDKSVELNELDNNLSFKAINLLNKGLILLSKNDYENALLCSKEALTIYDQIGDLPDKMITLVVLIRIFIQKKDKESISYYFDQIKAIYNANQEKEFIKVPYLFSKALILKESDRISDKGDAQKLFLEIINIQGFYDEVTIPAILNYLDSLVDELNQTGNEKILTEIEDTNKKLKDYAKKIQSPTLMTESLLIDAKISILKMDFEKAKVLLNQAQTSAQEKGIKYLAKKISKEHDNLLNKIEQWKSILAENSSLAERLELSGLKDTLQNMITKSVNDSKEEEEKGIIFLIVNSAGVSIYSKKFEPETSIQDQLMAGFLTAINSFSKETFETTENIERVKQGNNTLIIKNIGKLTICYAFKGSSYYANEKMMRLKSIIEIIDEFKVDYIVRISKETINYLNDQIESVFTNN